MYIGDNMPATSGNSERYTSGIGKTSGVGAIDTSHIR